MVELQQQHPSRRRKGRTTHTTCCGVIIIINVMTISWLVGRVLHCCYGYRMGSCWITPMLQEPAERLRVIQWTKVFEEPLGVAEDDDDWKA